MKTFADRFFEMAEILSDRDLVNLFNEWAFNTCSTEGIFSTDEFDEMCAGFSPMDIALKMRHGSFNPYYEYWTFDGYANFESIEDVRDYIDSYYLSDICDYFEENPRELLSICADEWEATEEEEEEEEE